jgi:hypothetical protein
MRVLRIVNDTAYDGRAIRSLVVACLRAQGLKVHGAVRIAYSSQAGGHHGVAALGDETYRPSRSGLNMALTLPRDPQELDEAQFARVVHHEVMHWRGVRHEDMTDEGRYCMSTWTPSWYAAWRDGREPVRLIVRDGTIIGDARIGWTPPRTVAPADERTRRIEHARAMLKKARTRVLRAQTLEARWRRRLGALERAALRASEGERTNRPTVAEAKEAAS